MLLSHYMCIYLSKIIENFGSCENILSYSSIPRFKFELQESCGSEGATFISTFWTHLCFMWIPDRIIFLLKKRIESNILVVMIPWKLVQWRRPHWLYPPFRPWAVVDFSKFSVIPRRRPQKTPAAAAKEECHHDCFDRKILLSRFCNVHGTERSSAVILYSPDIL
jgi:hypothetical protein